jgi:hypothetical protein
VRSTGRGCGDQARVLNAVVEEGVGAHERADGRQVRDRGRVSCGDAGPEAEKQLWDWHAYPITDTGDDILVAGPSGQHFKAQGKEA